jgi:hypothetical protein
VTEGLEETTGDQAIRLSNSVTKMLRVAFAYALAAFCIWYACSFFGWLVVPYRKGGKTPTNLGLWVAHVVLEKFASLIFTGVASFFAARRHHPTWRIGIFTALTTALLFQFIAMAVYIFRWGFVLYWTYNRFFSTVFYTVAIGCLCGFMAVCRQYLRDAKTTQCSAANGGHAGPINARKLHHKLVGLCIFLFVNWVFSTFALIVFWYMKDSGRGLATQTAEVWRMFTFNVMPGLAAGYALCGLTLLDIIVKAKKMNSLTNESASTV